MYEVIIHQPIFVALLLLSILTIGAYVLIARIESRMKRLLYRNTAKNLDETLSLLQKDIERLLVESKDTAETIKIIESRLQKSIRGVHTVRFNPFQGTSGSNQSFATTFLNALGDGVIVSSMYSRERVSVFAKPIKNFTSEYELTAEESDTIKKAREKIN
ncbi:MAG TPA: DUF4446 family protein [Candidatus Paceibacterota bacterium]